MISFQHELTTCGAGGRNPAVETPADRARTRQCQQEEGEEVTLGSKSVRNRRGRRGKHKLKLTEYFNGLIL